MPARSRPAARPRGRDDRRPGEASAAIKVLKGWDGDLRADSAPAALAEVWWMKHLKPALFARLAPDPAVRALLPPGDTDTLLALVEHPDTRLGADPAEARNRLLLETLSAAHQTCVALMGDQFERMGLGPAPPRLLRARVEPGRPRRDAGARCRAAAEGRQRRLADARRLPGERFSRRRRASVRIVVDVGDWDRSRCINAPASRATRARRTTAISPALARGDYVRCSTAARRSSARRKRASA
jgi:penicillin amidase